MADLLPLPDVSERRSGDSALASGAKISGPQPALASITASGPRKLVRPSLSANAPKKYFSRRGGSPLSAHQAISSAHQEEENSHAESFYLQKQAQSQTPMVFVMEDGERIEGCIEWYDRNSIKVRNQTKVLIYKSSIKYLYKAQDKD
jgi:sRNA-binding regulator protein Hfq